MQIINFSADVDSQTLLTSQASFGNFQRKQM